MMTTGKAVIVALVVAFALLIAGTLGTLLIAILPVLLNK